MPKISIILANLGTPTAPTVPAVSEYLQEFLQDPRVVDLNPHLWKWILKWVRFKRSPKVAHAYESIWTEKGSPLLEYSYQQAELLQQQLATRYPEHQIEVKVGMTYQPPRISEVATELFAKNPDHVILLPLYPQFSSTTTLAAIDGFNNGFKDKNVRLVPPYSIVHQYYNHPSYIHALANSIRQQIAQIQGVDLSAVDPKSYFSPVNKLFVSYHGIPTRFAEELKDPYPQQCEETTRLLAAELGLTSEQYVMTYQSVFGKEPWLTPATADTLVAHAKAFPNQAQAMLICPGFSVDCLETIEENGVENRDEFLEAGGASYHLVPCLNASSEHIRMMADLVAPHIQLAELSYFK